MNASLGQPPFDGDVNASLGQPPFDGDGGGVRIAIIDSGIHPDNPHIEGYAGGIAFADDGTEHDDLLDRLGHGTAVAAAIQEKAPGAELFAVRVFEASLTTRAANIARGIEWAARQEMHLVNLSLGSIKPESIDVLAAAMKTAEAAGTAVVSVHTHRGVRWLPGSLPGAIGVVADTQCPRDQIRLVDDGGGDGGHRGIIAASPLPRPIEGVAPERNISGISFAVANTSGFVARALARVGRLDGEIADWFGSHAPGSPAS